MKILAINGSHRVGQNTDYLINEALSAAAELGAETEVIELQLLQSQNELLQQLLHNADISSSSEIEAINELKQSVEEQSKQLSQCQETLDKFEEALDNHETVENIDTAKKPIQ